MKMIMKRNRYYSKASKGFGINGNIFSRSANHKVFSELKTRSDSLCWSSHIFVSICWSSHIFVSSCGIDLKR